MAEPFNTGDTVRLKSGGPNMTVTGVGDPHETGTVWVTCEWFDEKETHQSSTFPADALERV